MAGRSYATVTAPGVEKRYPDGPAVALSAAITLASKAHTSATFYVRDERGEAYGRVERDATGGIQIHRAAARGR